MTGIEIKQKCVPCGREFRQVIGKGIYESKFLPGYKMYVCNTCYSGNWDGYANHYDDQIISHCQNNGIKLPQRNAGGYLPRDYPGHGGNPAYQQMQIEKKNLSQQKERERIKRIQSKSNS